MSTTTTSNRPVAPAPKVGNPAVVGLAGFALTTFLLQLHNLGLGVGLGGVIWSGVFFGGLAQLIAGLHEQRVGNNFGYSAFTSFGAFWLCLCGIFVGNKYGFFAMTPYEIGWFLTAWTLYVLILAGAAIRISLAMALTFFTLIVGFVLLDARFFSGREELAFYAGIDLMVTAAQAWYLMAHIIYADVYGRDILPVGKPLVR